MTELTADGFDHFFRAVYGTAPFLWQQRLLDRVVTSGDWPRVIDLPTGTGKTATLDIALFALACAPAVHPRRIVFVIDRRIVVDQVAERGLQLEAALRTSDDEVVKGVADRLRAMSGGEWPLHVAALRGGVAVDDAWAHRPDQPTLIVSTVDQFGSRLLFRGYGVSARMQPVHAGLAGADCLVLLDEVHLSRPFAETLRSIDRFYRPVSSLPNRWKVVEMSATPGIGSDDVFRLVDEDLDPVRSPELARRVRARKRATLASVGKAKQDPWDVLPALCEREISRTEGAADGTTGIVVNRVRTARAIADRLRDAGHDVSLLTGRMRPFDRRDALEEVGGALDPDRSRDASTKTIVVGTQCIEVGADFSFDSLITECASLDALRQRFGRLDRRGDAEERTGSPAAALIIGLRSAVDPKVDDPVYGHAVAETWAALVGRHSDAPFDVGPISVDVDGFGEAVIGPAPSAPILLPAHLDAFIQTWPELAVGPRPDPFLHGIERVTSPDVRIVWRSDIEDIPRDDSEGRLGALIECLTVCPPRANEAMSVPFHAARLWLAGPSAGDEVPIGDAGTPSAVDEVFDSGTQPCALRWKSRDKIEPVAASAVEPGDLLVVPAVSGGIRYRNWDPTSQETVVDHGDRAQMAYGHRATVRLDPRVLPTGVPAPPVPTDDTTISDRRLVEQWLDETSAVCAEPGVSIAPWFRDLIDCLDRARLQVGRLGDSSAFVVTSPLQTDAPTVDPDLLDGSDESNSFTGVDVPLRDHLRGVGAKARQFAESLGLPDPLVADLELAGRLHDLGKADPRFQLLLHNGDEVEAACATELLAKSRVGSGARQRGLRRYPAGMRHELLSVAMALSRDHLLAKAHDRDLVLHLVASHHGYCRPLPPIVDDPAPEVVEFDLDEHRFTADTQVSPQAAGVITAERFWRVVERYGWFGAAWLESIFRLADHRRSEEETHRQAHAVSMARR